MLPLWFKDVNDYSKISGSDKLSILGLKDLAPGKNLTVKGVKKDGSEYTFEVTHTVSIRIFCDNSRVSAPSLGGLG